jgi:phosphate starvation-inducible protein PhoH and related proteins
MFTRTYSAGSWRKATLATSETGAVPLGPAHTELDVDGLAMVRLLGPQDRLLRTMERAHPQVRVLVRGNRIVLDGEEAEVAAARALVEELIQMVRNGVDLGETEVTQSARMLRDGGASPTDVLSQAILTSRGKSIRPKTLGQKAYVDAVDENTIVFGIGPAGTGKTNLAMAKAVQASASASFRAHSTTRSTRTSGRSTTRSTR